MAYLSGAAGGRRPSMAQSGAPRPSTASGRVHAALARDVDAAYSSMRAALSSGDASADEEVNLGGIMKRARKARGVHPGDAAAGGSEADQSEEEMVVLPKVEAEEAKEEEHDVAHSIVYFLCHARLFFESNILCESRAEWANCRFSFVQTRNTIWLVVQNQPVHHAL